MPDVYIAAEIPIPSGVDSKADVSALERASEVTSENVPAAVSETKSGAGSLENSGTFDRRDIDWCGVGTDLSPVSIVAATSVGYVDTTVGVGTLVGVGILVGVGTLLSTGSILIMDSLSMVGAIMSKGILATTGTVVGVGVFCTSDAVAGLLSPSIREDVVGVGVFSTSGTTVAIFVGVVSEREVKVALVESASVIVEDAPPQANIIITPKPKHTFKPFMSIIISNDPEFTDKRTD